MSQDTIRYEGPVLNVAQDMTAVGVLGALHMDVITDIAWSCDGRTLAVSTQLHSEASVKLAWVQSVLPAVMQEPAHD